MTKEEQIKAAKIMSMAVKYPDRAIELTAVGASVAYWQSIGETGLWNWHDFAFRFKHSVDLIKWGDWNFAAIDDNGKRFLYIDKPTFNGMTWDTVRSNRDSFSAAEYGFHFHDPANSLIKRPEPKQEYRPWCYDDDIVEIIVKHRDGYTKGIVTCQLQASLYCGGTTYYYKEMLKNWLQLDGSVCGVKI